MIFKLLSLTAFFFMWQLQGSLAQENLFLNKGESDPEAKKMIEEVIDAFDQMDSYRMDFNLEVLYPDGSKMLEQAFLQVRDDAYKFEMGDQLILSDGIYTWIFLKSRNEVQINDLDEDQSMLSPNYFLNFYLSEDYVYGITSEKVNQKGQKEVRVDFKPIGSFAEYKKIGIDLIPSTKRIKQLLILANDGSRIVLKDIKTLTNPSLSVNDFRFVVSDYPGIHVEDLRLD